MAVTVDYYNPYFVSLVSALFDHSSGGSTLKAMLTTSAYTYSKLHDFRDDITNEVVGTGYVAGGETITTPVVTQDDTNDQADMDFDDIEWTGSTITARNAILYKSVGSAATDNLWCRINFGADFSSSATTFRIEIDANGFQSLEAA